MAHVIAYKKKFYPNGMAGGGGGSFNATTIYESNVYNSNITLTDALSNYDYLIVEGFDSGNGGYIMTSFLPVEDISINNHIGITNDAYYLWYKVTTATTLVQDGRAGSLYISKIYGVIISEGSGGGGTSVIDYSTDEQDTGAKWIDGKTIYQKTYDLGNVVETPSSQWTNLNIDATNISRIINSEALGEDGTYWQTISVRCNQNALGIYNDRSGTIYVKYLTIRYIKVND